MISRRSALALTAAASTVALWPRIAKTQTLESVKIAKLTGVSDSPFYIGQAKGFFKDAGVDAEFTTFPQSNQVVPALAQGRIDGMGAAVGAGVWNSIGGGLPIKIVGDRGIDYKPYGGFQLIVRKGLQGQVKAVKDLKGMKFAEPGKGSANLPIVYFFLTKNGLKYDDVQHVFLPFPEQIAAFKNGSIDCAALIEPFATGAIEEGYCYSLGYDYEVYPRHQISAFMYNSDFMKQRPDAAKKFMIGYVRALRYYHDALGKDGKLTGPRGPEVISIIEQNIKLPDPAIFRRMSVSGDNTNGQPDTPSLITDYNVYKELNLIEKPSDPRAAIDISVAEAAEKALGPYKPA